MQRLLLFFSEQSTVGVTFDQADYTIAEPNNFPVTGSLTGLTGELQSSFSLTLGVDFSVNELTSEPLKLDLCTL